MKRFFKNILTEIDYQLTYNSKLRTNLYSSVIVALVVGIMTYLAGYKKRDNVLIAQSNEIHYLKQDTTELRDVISNYDIDILAYNKILDDKDYLRYIAFKYSNINIPKNVPKDDLKLINRYIEKFDIPQEYIWRLINKESRFNPNAKSHKGASGYMQIMPATYKSLYNRYTNKYGSLDKYNSHQKNLILGIYYLRILHDKYNDWTLTLAAYNAGPGNVDDAGKKVPKFKETENYVKYIKSK